MVKSTKKSNRKGMITLTVRCSIEFTELSKEDFSNLPQNIQKECFDILKKLENNVHMGLKLENNGIRDLSNCFKLYFHNAQYRIIYVKEKEKILIHQVSIRNKNIAKIVGIGKRANYEIYDIVAKRLNKFIDNKKNN